MVRTMKMVKMAVTLIRQGCNRLGGGPERVWVMEVTDYMGYA